MPTALGISIGVLIATGCGVWFAVRRARRRARLRAPFPPPWDALLQERVGFYRHLPQELKQELQHRIRVFLDEKRFEGCGGLVITDEIRVTIAAEACLLLLNRPGPCYPTLRSILVYPHPYMAPTRRLMGPMLLEEETLRAGESWQTGAVVLAWDAVQQGARNGTDGRNVALHEFAHQLDQEDGQVNGTPMIRGGSRFRAWASVLGTQFVHLQDDIARLQAHVIDDYGATSPAEFFAVVTEVFFEKPLELRATQPDLYRELAAYYQLDPATWPRDETQATAVA
jgi:Mlc titration factor MtfA (ptsG expression regulator)